MRKTILTLTVIFLIGYSTSSFIARPETESAGDSLRTLYSRPISQWPKPQIDSGAKWEEFAVIPADTTFMLPDKDPITHLGKILFFDPRLSGSNQISCSTCHDPDEAWQDGKVVALGNDHLQGSRNTQSLLNVYIYKNLFWDGRSVNFESQMIEPLGAVHEMNMDVPSLPEKLGKIDGYKTLFKTAYGDTAIRFSQIATALEAFQKTIKSRRTKFDEFIAGKAEKFTNDEIAGLDLFRNKARCMNCHNGTFLTDNNFHNIGLTYYGRKYEDLGRYKVTKLKEDVGRFRTPSLRELGNTSPWMHNGLFDNLSGVVNVYNSGMPQPAKTDAQKQDTLFPKTDRLIKPLNLTPTEKQQLVAFLGTLSGVPYRMRRPELPK